MLPPPRLIGLPYDASSSFLRGTAQAPPLIRQALHSPAGNSWTEGLVDLAAPGALTDAGDLDLPPTPEFVPLIEAGLNRLLDDHARPISLGGDHSVVWPILRAVAPRHPGLTVLHIDAHPDLYEDYEGDRLSHACPFARVLEAGLIKRLVSVGIRTMSRHQREQADRYGVETIDMRDWSRGARPTLEGPVYLSLDLDGLDPAFAPGVGHREPGGLTTRDAIGLIQALPDAFVGADVVEYNPLSDFQGMTAQVAAKLVKEIAGRMLA